MRYWITEAIVFVLAITIAVEAIRDRSYDLQFLMAMAIAILLLKSIDTENMK